MNRSSRLTRAALLAALTLLLTRVITIPVPTGYVNLGDCAVLLSAWLLNPLYAGMAAGIGSMLADILSGFAAYAPATFVIKFLMAFVAAKIFRFSGIRAHLPRCAVGAVIAELIMVSGYFTYESLVLGIGAAAAASIPANLLQGAVGALTGFFAIQACAKHLPPDSV